jgi:cold shock protein
VVQPTIQLKGYKDMKLQGTVVWFDAKKGFGFIKKEDGSGDIFVHYTNITVDGFKSLEAQQKVEYELGKNHRGEQAVNVKPLQ